MKDLIATPPRLFGLLAMLTFGAATAATSQADDEYPWNHDPEPITMALEPVGEPPEAFRLNGLGGREVEWLGELTSEELAELVTIEGSAMSTLINWYSRDGKLQQPRNLRLTLYLSMEPVPVPFAWVATNFETGRTAVGEAFPEPGNGRPMGQSDEWSDGQFYTTTLFEHPKYDAPWIADCNGTVTFDALHPRQARLVLEDIAEVDERTIHLDGMDDGRIHIGTERQLGYLYIHMDETMVSRVVDLQAYDADGRQIDVHVDEGFRRRTPGKNAQYRGFTGYVLSWSPNDNAIHRLDLLMHPVARRFDIPFAFDRFRIPYPDNILRKDDEGSVVAAEQPGDADESAVPALERDLEVIIE